MAAEKKNAPSTAATGTGAKSINLHTQNTTKSAERQAEGKIICLEERRHRCPDGVKWLYEELSATQLGKAFIKALILTAEAETYS